MARKRRRYYSSDNDIENIRQAKRYLDVSVGNEAVQQAVAAMKFYDCNKAMVITTSANFTNEAIALAKANSTELVSKARLSELLLTHLQESWC